MRRPVLVLALALLALAATGALACFDEPKPACAFSCKDGDRLCPEGYTCADDGICRMPGATGKCPLDSDADGGAGE